MAVCYGCSEVILDKYLLLVSPHLKWHEACLKCSACNVYLGQFPSCFIHDGKPYCKKDYYKLFLPHCHNCDEILERNSLVMKENDYFFHVSCFTCSTCGVRLLPGDLFSSSADGLLFCAFDSYAKHKNSSSNDCCGDVSCKNESAIGGSNMDTEHSPSPPTTESEPTAMSYDIEPAVPKGKSKARRVRVRTVLNQQQLSTLRRCYATNPRPDSITKENLAELTGLSARVVRVWFQNKRCKDKKKSTMVNQNDRTARIQPPLQSPLPRSEELTSLPVCSPPQSSAVSLPPFSPYGNSVVDQAVQNLQLMMNDRSNYRNNLASFSSYGALSKFGDYQHNYQDSCYSSWHFHQMVT